MRKNRSIAQTPQPNETEIFDLTSKPQNRFYIPRRKIIGWTASVLALVAAPAAAFAWSVNSTHFPTPATNQAKPITNVSSTSQDGSNATVSDNTAGTGNSQQSTVDSEDSSTGTNGTIHNNSTTQVTVNGQSLPVPANGSSTQMISGDGQPTNVSITHQSSSSTSGSGTSKNSNNITIQTNSSSANNINSDTSL